MSSDSSTVKCPRCGQEVRIEERKGKWVFVLHAKLGRQLRYDNPATVCQGSGKERPLRT